MKNYSNKFHFHLLAGAVTATCLLAHLYAKTGDENCLFGMVCGVVVFTIQIFKGGR